MGQMLWRVVFVFWIVNILDCAFINHGVELKPPAKEFTQHRIVIQSSVIIKRGTSSSQSASDVLSLAIPLGDKDVVLDLKLNTDMMSKLPGNGPEELCEYIGNVRSVETSRAAVSVCGNGFIQGTVFDGNDTFYIETATQDNTDDTPHLYYVYNRRDLIKQNRKPATSTQDLQHLARRRSVRSAQTQESKAKGNLIINVLLVTGHSILRKNGYNKKSAKAYCRRLMNDVSAYYTDLDVTVKYAGRLQVLPKTERRIVDRYNKNDRATVHHFKDYLLRHNNISVNYDLAVFLSDDLFIGRSTAGLAFEETICSGTREDAAAVITTTESWFMTATTMAHEMGHVLGLGHEEYESEGYTGCPADEDDTTYLMSTAGEPDKAEWSPCSKEVWRKVRDSGKMDCLIYWDV